MWYIHTTNCYLAIKKSKVWTYAKHCMRAAKLLQSCPTLFNPMDCRPPGSSVYGILLARILKGVAMPFSGDLPDSRIEPTSLMSPTLAGKFFTIRASWEAS